MTKPYRITFNMSYERGDHLEAVVDLVPLRKAAEEAGYMASWEADTELPAAEFVWEYLKANKIPYSIEPGPLMLEDCTDIEGHPTFVGDCLSEDEITPADGIPEEFREKQRNLAVFLFNMNNGPVASVTEWLDEYGDTDYYANYMADAAEILKLQPHLLSYGARAEMGIEP